MDGSARPATTSAHDAIERARSVGGLLRAAGARIDEARELPADVVAAMHEARLFRGLLPRSIGGDELDLVTHARVIEAVATADASAAWCLGQGAGCAMAAAFLSPEAAQRLFGPKDAVLAWGAGLQGRAVPVDGGYRVTGRWTFASGSRHATLLGGHSRVFEADGRPRLRPDGRQLDITALFPRCQARIDDVWHVVGLKGTGSDTFEVDDLLVPGEHCIDREDAGTLRETGPLYKFPATLAYGTAFGGLMLGIAQGMLDDLTALAMTKTPRGATLSLRDNPAFQTQLAQLTARVRAARAYHHTTLATVWREVARTGTLTLAQRVDCKLASTWIINQGADVVVEAYRAAGQTAIFPQNGFERRLRDALTASQQTQARATNYITTGRCLLGLEPDTLMFL